MVHLERYMRGSSTPRIGCEVPQLRPLFKRLLTEETAYEVTLRLLARPNGLFGSGSTKLGTAPQAEGTRDSDVGAIRYDDILGEVEGMNGGEGVFDRDRID